ncbi:hypothetical protein SAMN06296036_12591 [Pseudobacteriovorax antillogorgiicola]|uniref:Lysophospholipase L1 n=1 Tax=Pseudobacteriovorax antillogorgiicola TaxID=1513793 RepID=A0A1Y6CRD7_9BACT|nr:hypothetical protein EDD56_12591 [Pseudobacteriovorax antillogorgiicola]SMF70101.1 hypothetical protein SAMN06296036_12591 [Pseudobacteriovorax antillogorgiicola]
MSLKDSGTWPISPGLEASPPESGVWIDIETFGFMTAVGIRYTTDGWNSFKDVQARYEGGLDGERSQWGVDLALQDGISLVEFVVYGDSNSGRIWDQGGNHTVGAQSYWIQETERRFQSGEGDYSDLSSYSVAMWGSSVCNGTGAEGGKSWVALLEEQWQRMNGPQIIQASYPGHNTNDKERQQEFDKIQGSDFVVLCLSMGNHGLERQKTEESAFQITQWYLNDMFYDQVADSDPESLIHRIRQMGAEPIVALVYPKGDYQKRHCEQVVKANIIQQSWQVPTINYFGSVNGGNRFNPEDCQWTDGSLGTLNTQKDASHPNSLGHREMYYAFPPDLPFAIKAGKETPAKPEQDGGLNIDTGYLGIVYEAEFPMTSFTTQFDMKGDALGVIAMVHLAGGKSLQLINGKEGIFLHSDLGWYQWLSSHRINWTNLAVSYSHARQVLSVYLNGGLVYERRLTYDHSPLYFALGNPNGSEPARDTISFRNWFVNRTALHSEEVALRSRTDWLGAGSLDIFAPLAGGIQNRAQTLQRLEYRTEGRPVPSSRENHYYK